VPVAREGASFFRIRPSVAAAAIAVAVMSACTPPPADGSINDPFEKQNRTVHRFNKSVDQFFFGGGGRRGVVPPIPRPVASGFSNFIENVGAPGNAVNGILQGDGETVGVNILRFALNTTVGIGGLFDPATAIGLLPRDTDFGETLHVWGAPEGAFVEIPFLGPSTERDLAGRTVDVALNPINWLAKPPNSFYLIGLQLGDAIADRQRFADTVESIYYESADSYIQSRLLYLQNRRFELGEEEEVFDPYADPFAE
jgi:phospholipid-binding lipoprotein MlaA